MQQKQSTQNDRKENESRYLSDNEVEAGYRKENEKRQKERKLKLGSRKENGERKRKDTPLTL